LARTRTELTNPIDVLMEAASKALVHRQYFDAEHGCMDALRMAFASQDYERMSRIVLPLEEARRQKRDMAFDAGRVTIVENEMPTGKKLVPGCYLICPPRVGLDGRLLREEADKMNVPTIIVTREPTTREGLWPIVALGPVTVRLKIPPPVAVHAGHGMKNSGEKSVSTKRAAKGSKKVSSKPPSPTDTERAGQADGVPTREWFLHACEALGDAAIASVDPEMDVLMRVDALLKRLEAHPDHEKLHQVLGDCCREAAVEVVRAAQSRRPVSTAARTNDPEDMDDFDL